MKVLHYGHYRIEVPENFNELTGSQLVKLMNVVMQHQDDVAENMLAKVEALKIVGSKSGMRFYMLPPDAVLAFTEEIAWLFKNNTLTANLLPKYDGFYGPSAELANLRMKEFHYTEQHYKSFVENSTEEAELNNLIAVLYRPARADGTGDMEGDYRCDFAPHLITAHAHRIAQWPLAVRLAILFFYDGCRQYIVSLYDEVFTGESSGEPESPYGMYALMMELAGDKLGTVDKVENMQVHTALASLEIMLQKAEQIANQTPSTS